MFEQIKDNFIGFITSRLMVLLVVIIFAGGFLLYRVFDLQIVNGEAYLNNFQLKIEKQRTLPSTRGNIYDCNGKLLAYNELAYSVTIEDVFDSSADKNRELNDTIYRMIKLIEEGGDEPISNFNIILSKTGQYTFSVEGSQLQRFLADVYGYSSTKDLKYKQSIATADEVVEYLCGRTRFAIGDYEDPDDKSSFVVGKGYSKVDLLKVLTVRYNMNANSYQKYISTTIAEDVSQETVARILENSDVLDGVSISEGTVRKYNYSTYISQIVGYTGKISQDELANLQQEDSSYDLNDTVGKSGIESAMETTLQGRKGSETVYVDNVGRVIDSSNRIEATAGNDVYLTINIDLQVAATKLLEQQLAGILLAKIQNIKEYIPADHPGVSDFPIPIYDVYYALFDNYVIDTSHFTEYDASETEKAVQNAYEDKQERVLEKLRDELLNSKTPYDHLSTEYKVYESYIASELYNSGILNSSAVDRNDETYIAWTTDETISLYDFLTYAISVRWVDASLLNIESRYSDSEEVYETIVDHVIESLSTDEEFGKKLYKYMIKNDEISGRQVCQILLDQGIVLPSESEIAAFESGAVTPYVFMRSRIEKLEITPAQLALDPCSGSIVITDVNTGDVLALVSYPSYDNNLMANGVDADYYNSLRKSKASPLINYATYQKTAPGSTYKMVSATAGLEEGVITTSSTITCTGVFDKLDTPARCWISPGAHGSLNVSGAITNSCNSYFYEVGYRLSQVGENTNSEIGLNMLRKYCDLYGLTDKSGIEIEEAEPEVSDMDPVRSAIGQGTNNFTTVGLARYVTTVANNGTCYNLTLIDHITDSDGNLLQENHATVRNQVELDNAEWKALHIGMRGVVEKKAYFNEIAVNVAGKTGTAQESKSRSNHALFVSYAPYEAPEIAVAVRIAHGYSSDYAARTACSVYKYYFGLAEEDELLSGTATNSGNAEIGHD